MKGLNGHSYTNENTKGKTLTARLRQRNNCLIIHANNLGSVPPNTIAVVINDGSRRRMVTLRSDEGKSAATRLLRPIENKNFIIPIPACRQVLAKLLK